MGIQSDSKAVSTAFHAVREGFVMGDGKGVERHRYYCLFRPPMLGAIPRGAINIEDFGDRKFVGSIDRDAWGYAEYDHALTDKQVYDYELMAGEVR